MVSVAIGGGASPLASTKSSPCPGAPPTRSRCWPEIWRLSQASCCSQSSMRSGGDGSGRGARWDHYPLVLPSAPCQIWYSNRRRQAIPFLWRRRGSRTITARRRGHQANGRAEGSVRSAGSSDRRPRPSKQRRGAIFRVRTAADQTMMALTAGLRRPACAPGPQIDSPWRTKG